MGACVMSVGVMTAVFAESEARGNDRLVLLAIADEADDDGTNAFPGTKRLAMKVRLPERTVRRCIDRLVDSGELGRRLPERQGRGKLTHYTVLVGKVDTLTPFQPAGNENQPGEDEKKEAEGGQKVDTTPPLTSEDAEYPVLSTQRTLGAEQARPQKRPRDPLWDALIEACGFTHVTPTPTERGAWNKALKEIRDSGGTPDLVHERARAYRTTWPKVRLTPTALARHWGALGADEANSDEDLLASYGLTRG